MTKRVFAAVLTVISLIVAHGSASAQELAPGEIFGLQPGSFMTFRQTPTGWLIIDNGPAKDVNTNPPGPKDAVRFVFAPAPQKGTMLTVWNGYGKRLLYQGAIMVEDGGRAARTSICPVQANVSNIEFWPQQLAQINITAMELVEDGGPSVCK